MKPRLQGIVRVARIALPAMLAAALVVPSVRAQDKPLLITLDADNLPVTEVLQILASKTGLNIVTAPDVQAAKISIHLHDTQFDEALNLVVRAAGLGYERVGKSILVADPRTLDTQTGLETRVFDLHYANALELKELLQVGGREVSASPNGRRLAIRANAGSLEEVSALIDQLDRKPRQVQFEARLIEVNTTSLLELGIDWEKITKWTTVITEGYQGPSDSGQIPKNLNFLNTDQSPHPYRQAYNFEVAIDALLTNGSAHLLSNTKVVTLDNKPAEIFSGNTVPVVITSLTSPGATGGVLQTVQLEKIDVGVKLDITPRVSDDGYITTLVQPEVSTIVGFRGPDNDLPETSTRRANTLVRVKDGQKIYLGGLLSEDETRTVKKIPLLGDIPILGRLFRHYRIEKTKTDLVIEITPKIVGDEGASLPVAPQNEGE